MKQIDPINTAYIRAITKPNTTQDEQTKALHAYLTDPRRTVPVKCHCLDCEPSCAMCGGAAMSITEVPRG